MLWKWVVSVWPEGTLGRTSPLRIRQTCPVFFHGPQRPCRARTQKFAAFRGGMDFLRFSGPKTPKILPGCDATCVRCRISFIFAVGCPGGAPHTRWQKLGAFRETAQVPAVEVGGFGMAGGDPRSHVSASHPPNLPHFFHGPQRPCRARTQKFAAFRARMDFLRFSGPKTPKILPGRDATCVGCRISFIFAVGCPGGAPHALAKVGCIP